MEQRIAIFPGSFDPYTIGHASIVDRALPLFDKIVVAIGVNRNKRSFLTEEQRIRMIADLYADEPKVEVISYDGLTVDAARECGAAFPDWKRCCSTRCRNTVISVRRLCANLSATVAMCRLCFRREWFYPKLNRKDNDEI